MSGKCKVQKGTKRAQRPKKLKKNYEIKQPLKISKLIMNKNKSKRFRRRAETCRVGFLGSLGTLEGALDDRGGIGRRIGGPNLIGGCVW